MANLDLLGDDRVEAECSQRLEVSVVSHSSLSRPGHVRLDKGGRVRSTNAIKVSQLQYVRYH